MNLRSNAQISLMLLLNAKLFLENGFGDRPNFFPRYLFGREVKAFAGLLGDDLFNVATLAWKSLNWQIRGEKMSFHYVRRWFYFERKIVESFLEIKVKKKIAKTM
jgi:hypothetical protein